MLSSKTVESFICSSDRKEKKREKRRVSRQKERQDKRNQKNLGKGKDMAVDVKPACELSGFVFFVHLNDDNADDIFHLND